MSESIVLAHGLSGGRDVPIPFGFAVIGAAVAVFLSFVVATLLQKESVLTGGASGRAVAPGLQRILDSSILRGALRVLGLGGAVFFFVAAAYGSTDPNINPAPGIVYVFFWFGLVPLSLLFGPVWKLLNPLRTLHRCITTLGGLPAGTGVRPLPLWVGYWPAALGLLAFTWLELVAPRGDQPRVLLLFFGLYAIGHLVAATVFGSEWFDRADAFEAYSTLAGRLAPVGRRTDGRLALRNPFDGLDSIRPEAGLVAFVCVWLGSTAYDGFTRSAAWREILQFGLGNNLMPLNADAVKAVGFALTISVTTALFIGCTALAGSFGGSGIRGLPQRFVHSLVPIAIGYTIAHYFTLAVFAGQRTAVLASDPLDTGADLFGTAGYEPDYTVISNHEVALVQIAAVVGGHILGVVAAHDRSARLFARRRAVATQIPLMALMLSYTVAGLSLLFAT